MAINDYITCCKCDVKLIYDGGKDNNRQWWEERWGKEPEIMCPDCQNKPLSDEQIQAFWEKAFDSGSSPRDFARAIEAAHGIREESNT